MPGELRIDRPADAVCRLTIDNPDKRNALDHDILDAIAREVPRLDARCLLITATGSVFSAGYDIGNLQRDDLAERAEALVAHPFTAAIEAIEAYPHPTVAALNGHAIGGGLELAITCDLRIAAEEAKLGMPPAKLGLVYSHTGLRKFIDTIGTARTRELFYTARTITAPRAEAWGLVNQVVPERELEHFAIDYAASIAENAPLSLSGNKRVIRELLAAEGALAEDVARELVELREACFDTEDFAEGVRAFGEKRPPRWQGR